MEAEDDDFIDISQFEMWKGAFEVPNELLVGPEWNANEMSPEKFNELCEETKGKKFDQPCGIVPIPGEKLFLVVDGDHRRRACIVNKKKTTPCCLKDHLDPSDIEALKEYSVRRNNLRGDPNHGKLAAIESDLRKKWKKSSSAIRRRLLIRSKSLSTYAASAAAKEVAAQQDVEADNPEVAGKAPITGSNSTNGAKNKPFTPGRKKTPEQSKEAAEKAVTLAQKHKMEANLRSLAKTLMATCEDDDSLEHGYAWFGQGGRCHLVLEMSPGLTKQIKALVKAKKADKGGMDEFLEKVIAAGLHELKQKPKKVAAHKKQGVAA